MCPICPTEIMTMQTDKRRHNGKPLLSRTAWRMARKSGALEKPGPRPEFRHWKEYGQETDDTWKPMRIAYLVRYLRTRNIPFGIRDGRFWYEEEHRMVTSGLQASIHHYGECLQDEVCDDDDFTC